MSSILTEFCCWYLSFPYIFSLNSLWQKYFSLHGTAVLARQMWETGCLNWAQFMLQWFSVIPIEFFRIEFYKIYRIRRRVILVIFIFKTAKIVFYKFYRFYRIQFGKTQLFCFHIGKLLVAILPIVFVCENLTVQ